MSDIEDDNVINQPTEKAKKPRRGKNKDPEAPENTGIIRVKEFDINSIPPHSVEEAGKGVKIVVIGKPGCFAPGTKVLYYSGEVKNVEHVQVGDILMGDDHTPRIVQELYHDTDQMFTITPSLGQPYTVNRLHDLVLLDTVSKTTVEISVETYLNLNPSEKEKYNTIRNTAPIKVWNNPISQTSSFSAAHYGLLFALLLQEKSMIFENEDQFIADTYKIYSSAICNWPYDFATYKQAYTETGIKFIDRNERECALNALTFITDLKTADYNTRWDFVCGFVTHACDHFVGGMGLVINQDVRNTFNEDLQFIFRSVGFHVQEQFDSWHNGDWYISGPCQQALQHGKNIGIAFSRSKLNFVKRGNDGDESFKLPTCEDTDVSGSTFTVTPEGKGEYFGFRLDGNRRFLLANFEVVKNTGKSTIINDIVATKANLVPVAQIFSGTEDSNHFYSSRFPPVCVYNKLDMDAIRNFVTRQKIAKQYLPNPWALQIIDDCTDNPHIFRDPLIQAYYKNGRHWNMVHILSLQYSMDIPPAIRTNIDYTFILRETNLKNRKNLHENYAGCIPSFHMFEQVMDAITQDYTALVINNRIQSNKFEDCVFYYKAKPDSIPPNWKFGHYSAWEFSNERNDNNFFDPLMS